MAIQLVTEDKAPPTGTVSEAVIRAKGKEPFSASFLKDEDGHVTVIVEEDDYEMLLGAGPITLNLNDGNDSEYAGSFNETGLFVRAD